MTDNLAFGPVPSRRLGYSLGVNNIPPKHCSYSCLYCQVGQTTALHINREEYYQPKDLADQVKKKVDAAREKAINIDYITFVADGEPTLDSNLGEEIELFRNFGIKIAVITNASLIWREDVREDLSKADWVSLKVDTVSEEGWHKINRPHGKLKIQEILKGIAEFSGSFQGRLVTESMLLDKINDSEDEITMLSRFLSEIKPEKVYLAVPTRPPVKRVNPADMRTLTMAYHTLRKNLSEVEFLIGYEGNAFAATGNAAEDLLSITAVHPMRREAVEALLARNGEDVKLLDTLLQQKLIKEAEYEGHIFYVRNYIHKE